MAKKKIQMSTVRKMADVQVIELNAALIARVVEAQLTTSNLHLMIRNGVKTIEAGVHHDYDEAGDLLSFNIDDLKTMANDLDSAVSLLNDLKSAFLDNEDTDE